MGKLPDFVKTVLAFEAGKGEPFPACHVGHDLSCSFSNDEGGDQLSVDIWCRDCDTEFTSHPFETPEEHELLRQAAKAGGWEQSGPVTSWEAVGYGD